MDCIGTQGSCHQRYQSSARPISTDRVSYLSHDASRLLRPWTTLQEAVVPSTVLLPINLISISALVRTVVRAAIRILKYSIPKLTFDLGPVKRCCHFWNVSVGQFINVWPSNERKLQFIRISRYFKPATFVDIFAKYWPIFTIFFSLAHSLADLQ